VPPVERLPPAAAVDPNLKERTMRHTLLALAVLAVACGGSSSPSSADEVRTLNGLAADSASATSTYGSQAAAMSDTTSCNADESTYEARIRPMITRMRGMGPSMDLMMTSLGHPADSDIACGADAMMAELDRHHAAACASTTDMSPNEAEAQNHVTMMTAWADHQEVRTYAMGTMMGAGMMGGMGMGGMAGNGMTTGHCVHDQDGSYSMLP
jgi:hypothetical protein